MRTCEEYEDLLSGLLDGKLTEAERQELETHLAECPACRACLADLRAIQGALQELDVPAPAGFADRVMEQVRATPQARPEKKTVRLPRRRWMAAAAGLWALRPDTVPAGSLARSGGEPAPYDADGGLDACSLDDGAAIALPGGDGAPVASLYAGTLTTGSGTAAAWVEEHLGLTWESGGRYELTEEEYTALRDALTEAGADFTETTGETGGYLLVAE